MRLTEDQVIAGLEKRGVPTHVAQGVTMNFRDESGLDTGIQEAAPISGRGGFGLAQWTGPRRVALEQYAAAQGKPMDDPDLQLDFFMIENANSEAYAWSKVMASSTSGEAAANFVTHWERPAPEHEQSRRSKYLGTGYQPGSNTGPLSGPIELPSWPGDQQLTRGPEAPDFWQVASDAYHTEQTLPWLFKGGTDTMPDGNWSLVPDRLLTDLKDRGLDVGTYAPQLGDSHSEAHYQENLKAAEEDFARVQRLQQAGMTGTVLQIANQILDPVSLASDLAASAVVPQLVLGKRASRLSRALTAGMAGAAGGFASEGINAAVNPHHDSMDVLLGTVFGFGVGGAVGALRKADSTVYESAQLQAAGQRAANEYSGVAMPGSVGAAKASPQKNFLNDEGFEFLDERDFAETFGAGVRWDLSAKLQSSPNVVTKAGAGLVQDGTGKKNGALNSIAASEEAERFFGEMSTAYARTYVPQLKEFMKDSRAGVMGRAQAELEFNRQIDRYIRDRRVDRADHYPDSVKRAGDKQAQLYADALKLQQNPFMREGLEGRPVKGSASIAQDANYAPRYWDPRRLILASRDYKDGTIEELIAKAMRSANPDLPEDVLKRTAKGFTKAIVGRAHGMDDMAVRVVGADNMETLVQQLMHTGNISRADAEALLATFRKTDDAGRDAHNKKRLLLDESARLDAPQRRDGTVDEKGLSLDELINQDASFNFSRYMRGVSGRVALARYRFKDPQTGEVLINGFTSDGEFVQYLDKVRQKNADLIAAGKITAEQGANDIKRLEFAYTAIMGRPLHQLEQTNTGWLMRAMRKFHFTRLMGQVGFAQITEIGMPIASLGVKASFSQFPGLRRMLNQDGETILKSGLANDLEAWLGVGTDRLRAADEYRLDDLTGIHDLPTGTWRDKVEGGLNKASRVTGEVSGLTQVNVMLERWTAASIVQRFANMAHGGKMISEKRLADLGLDKTMTERVLKMFREPGSMEYAKGSVSGRKVTRAKFDQWSDKEAREAFLAAAHRLGRQLIQKNDIGNMAMWMSHPAAKLILQFRTFMLGAWGKQTLKLINFRDPTAFNTLLLTTALAGASYVAQSKIASIGRSDRDEFLDKRLSPASMATAAFARSGASSIIPMLIDTGMYATGQDALFSHTRTTGQVSNMIFGNPTMGGFDDLAQAGRAVSGLFGNHTWSQEEAKALARIMPFGNALPVVMGLNALISGRPLFAPRNRD